MHAELSGVARQVELTLRVDDAVAMRLTGALLWTHFGISGPVTLNMSRHWLRARLEGRVVSLTVNYCPGLTFEQIDGWWMTGADGRPPSTQVVTALSTKLPASVAAAVLARTGIDAATTLAHFKRDDRRRLSHALAEWPLDGDRRPRLHLRRGHGGRRGARRNRSRHHGIAGLSGSVPGRRNPGRRRPDRRLQFPVGVVERSRGGRGSCDADVAAAFQPAGNLRLKNDATDAL